jgi:catechol 2,3-dioxygenase-like lactoylglutathione lyase family enzyme
MPRHHQEVAFRGQADKTGAMIGRLHHVVIDGPDPLRLANFYSAMLGLPVTYQDEDWVVIAQNDTSSGIAFQRAPNHQAPRWPDPNFPQQLHLDIMVDDVAQAEPEVLALGATPLPGTSTTSRVYADPAGHPFCLIPRPGWAAPVHPTTDAM